MGSEAALAVGAAFGASALISGAFSGASMNPARSLGPAVVVLGEPIRKYWIYLVGPVVGSLLAVTLAWIFNTKPNPEAAKTASGGGDAAEKKPPTQMV